MNLEQVIDILLTLHAAISKAETNDTIPILNHYKPKTASRIIVQLEHELMGFPIDGL